MVCCTNKTYDNIVDLWLGGDHYKWRLMRSNGVSEKYITGDASNEEKFKAWAETVSVAFGNALYHWSHLEMRDVFGIEEVITKIVKNDVHSYKKLPMTLYQIQNK